jgi:hypothetical protein
VTTAAATAAPASLARSGMSARRRLGGAVRRVATGTGTIGMGVVSSKALAGAGAAVLVLVPAETVLAGYGGGTREGRGGAGAVRGGLRSMRPPPGGHRRRHDLADFRYFTRLRAGSGRLAAIYAEWR